MTIACLLQFDAKHSLITLFYRSGRPDGQRHHNETMTNMPNKPKRFPTKKFVKKSPEELIALYTSVIEENTVLREKANRDLKLAE